MPLYHSKKIQIFYLFLKKKKKDKCYLNLNIYFNLNLNLNLNQPPSLEFGVRVIFVESSELQTPTEY